MCYSVMISQELDRLAEEFDALVPDVVWNQFYRRQQKFPKKIKEKDQQKQHLKLTWYTLGK